MANEAVLNDTWSRMLTAAEAERDRYKDALNDIRAGTTACDWCGVTYREYVGPCQEMWSNFPERSLCPGTVSVRGRVKLALSPTERIQHADD